MCLVHSLLSQPEPCGSSWSLSVFPLLPFNGKNLGLLESRWKQITVLCGVSIDLFILDAPDDDFSVPSQQANGHAERIDNVKPMFVEPKGKGTFNEVSVVLLNTCIFSCKTSLLTMYRFHLPLPLDVTPAVTIKSWRDTNTEERET